MVTEDGDLQRPRAPDKQHAGPTYATARDTIGVMMDLSCPHLFCSLCLRVAKLTVDSPSNKSALCLLLPALESGPGPQHGASPSVR